MPSPLSVTLLNVPLAVPAPRLKTTVEPPVGSWLPLASLAVSVTVVVSPDWMDAGFTETVDCDASAGPTTVMVGAVEVRAVPSMAAVMVLVPAMVPVKVAV